MVKKEVLITYKRRRFSKDSNSANKESDISEDNKHCNDTLEPNLTCLFPSNEIKDPEMMVTSDKAAEHSKEKFKFSLITFTRRAKRKRDETEKNADLSTNTKNKPGAQESALELCTLSEHSQLLDHDEMAVVEKKSEIKHISSEQARLNETIISSQTSNEDQSNTPIEISVSNVEKDHACACNTDSSKFLINANPGNFVESQSSSTPNSPIVLNKNIDDARKELEWLEDMDKVLQERKKKVDFCLVIKQSGINCKEAQSPGFSNHVIPSQEQGQSSGSNNHVTPLQELPLLTTLDTPILEKHPHEETPSISSHYRNFIDQVSGNNQYKSHPFTTERPFYPRQRHTDEYSIIGKTRSKESNFFTSNTMFSMYSNEWSEQELDHLWIGIRRHGVNNWNAILRDPKLHFSSSKIPEDLAMQWKIEHRKFLNQDNNAAALSRPKEVNQCAVETKLTLGDVYHRKRNTFGSYRNDSSRYLQMPMRTQNAANAATYNHTFDRFMHDYSYTRNSMNFPYTEASSSSGKRSMRNDQPWKVNEASVSLNQPWKVKASKTFPVKYSSGVEAKGLVIIDSGATSEDTISE